MQHNPKYTSKTIKHDGGNVIAFSGHGVGAIYKIDTRMVQYVYQNILLNIMMPYADDNMLLRWSFMHDHEPKHCLRLVRSCLEENNINVLEWSVQSPDLNPIDSLWNDVEQHAVKAKPKNLVDLWTEIEKAWCVISVQPSVGLVERLPRRSAAIIKNNGNPTKF